jgi:cytoskeletal protein RodZ
VGEFGDKFRKAREKKDLSLDDISNVTKISSRMLQAIEQEHFDQLPGGVFNKGFIRAYAKHLGLDSEDAVTDYLACLRQAQIDSHAGWDAEPRNGRSAPAAQKSTPATPAKVEPKAMPVKAQPPAEGTDELPELQLPRAEHVRGGKKEYLSRASGNPRLLFALIAVLIIAGILFWIRHSRSARATASKSNESPITASAAAPAPASPARSVSGAPAVALSTGSVAPSSSVATSSPVAAAADSQPVTEQSKPANGNQPSSAAPDAESQPSTEADDLPVKRSSRTASTTVADPTQVKVERKGDVTIRSFGSGASKAADKSAASLTLVVRASENSWISVTSDGQLLTQETLIAPAATSFHANRELVVRVGNAAGISFLYKGEELPAQGGEAEAKTFIFDAQGMRVQASAPAPAQN